jgi:eukaryotic-like serine/threonine-protein kinase
MPPEELTNDSGGTSPPRPPALHPDVIGPYRIVRVLGEGGMGLVYEAEQLEPLQRTVALKVIRRGMDTDEVLARFESERRALAVMDHPNIARALDAGTTVDGLPYFVMELVAGEPITDYCDRHALDLRGRLELFVAVCKGVQHAHQKGVIHRDLKPSNILVRLTDGRPVPVIIDFGIARAVERPLDDGRFATAIGVMVGTPVYMSPEQASQLDIDTRADIYSLGMVLYQLVTGVLPFEFHGLLPIQWIARYVLGQADVPTPSHRVATLEGERSAGVAHERHTTPVGLHRQLTGDLDWIVLKAIARDRVHRYETANALALDIERHLEHKPVVARPPTLGYTAAKFVRRHRLGVSVLATAVVALAIGVASIARERTRAEREGAKAQAISGFLQDMLESADPWEGGARQTTVIEALRAGVQRLDSGSVADPLVAASIRRTIGRVYLSLGRTPEADTLIRAALAIRLEETGAESEETAESYGDLGHVYFAQGKFDSAAPLYERALQIVRRRLGDRDTTVANVLLDLADVAGQMGARERADSLSEEALRIVRRAYPAGDLSVVAAMSRVHGAQFGAGNLVQAESTGRAALAMLRDLGLERHPQAVPILNDLALNRAFQGDPAEGLALMRQVLKLDSALFGTSHPYLATHLENLGTIYQSAGFNDSTRTVVRQALTIRRAMLADDNPAIGRSLFNLATAEYVDQNYDSAEPLFEEALVRMRRAYGPEHTDVVYATGALGRNQYFAGRKAEAERNLRRALDVTNSDGRLEPRYYARFGAVLLSLLVQQSRWVEAEPLALRVLAIQDSLKDTLALVTAGQLAAIYKATGRGNLAAEYLSRGTGAQ